MIDAFTLAYYTLLTDLLLLDFCLKLVSVIYIINFQLDLYQINQVVNSVQKLDVLLTSYV